MTATTRSLIRVPVLILAAATGALSPPSAGAADGIKAAYVEDVIPAKTWFGAAQAPNNDPVALGPVTGVFGVTSVTFTNYDSGPQQLVFWSPAGVGGTDCTGSFGVPVFGSAGSPQAGFGSQWLYLQPSSSITLTFPVPLVMNAPGGPACLAFEITTLLSGGSVMANVSGVIN